MASQNPNNSKLLQDTTSTQLQGIIRFISNGFTHGELNPDMTLIEFLQKVNKMLDEKNSGYNKKLRDVKKAGNEDKIFG